MQERHEHGGDRAERRADERDEVGEGDPQRQHFLERHAGEQQRRRKLAAPAINEMIRLPAM